MDKNHTPIFYVTGMPRSASSLLMQLLGQNPNHYVSPTSGLVDIFSILMTQWRTSPTFAAEGFENVIGRIRHSLGGVIRSYYTEELRDGKVVFDKSRGWLGVLPQLEDALQEQVKMIVTVRDVRAVIASFEKRFHTRGVEWLTPSPPMHNIVNRIDEWCRPGGVIGGPINFIRDALNSPYANRLIIVPANYLTQYPDECLGKIHDSLGLSEFDYDAKKVDQITHEDDVVHGMGQGLHDVRSTVEPLVPNSWEGVLPDNIANELATRYSDINALARVESSSSKPAIMS